MSRLILTALFRSQNGYRSRFPVETTLSRRNLCLSITQCNANRSGNGGDGDKFESLFEYSKSRMNKANASASQQNVNQLFKPLIVKPNPDDINLGEEIVGFKLEKPALLRLLNKFNGKNVIRELGKEHGLDNYLYNQVQFKNISYL